MSARDCSFVAALSASIPACVIGSIPPDEPDDELDLSEEFPPANVCGMGDKSWLYGGPLNTARQDNYSELWDDHEAYHSVLDRLVCNRQPS